MPDSTQPARSLTAGSAGAEPWVYPGGSRVPKGPTALGTRRPLLRGSASVCACQGQGSRWISWCFCAAHRAPTSLDGSRETQWDA